MSLNPSGANNYGWNYSKPDKPGYSTTLVGTVVAIQEVQKMGYTMNGQPGAPEFWPDGNPKMNIRLALATPDGSIKTFTFQPAGKAARAGQKPSVHMDLWHLTGDTDMMNLIGKTIGISTQEGHYGQGNPRPWSVGLVDGGPYGLTSELPSEFKAPQVLANNAVSGGQYQQMPQQPAYQQPVQQAQPAYQQAQPAYQQPVQQAQPAYQQAQPAYQQAQPAYQQPVQQGYPQGMDPSVAAAMQQMNVAPSAVTVTRQADPAVGMAYGDDEAPF